MRTPMVAGNWKMNTSLSEAVALVKEMREGLDGVQGVQRVLCPPFISLAAVKELVSGTSIQVGAQNMYYEPKGAYTGEIAPGMLLELCDYVILGHSERRQYFGESDEIVNRKVQAALAAGLKPIMCVGERLEENEAGRTEEVVTTQVRGGLRDIEQADGLVVAYEPIWAIGTGRAATGEGANATIRLIRDTVARQYGDGFAGDV